MRKAWTSLVERYGGNGLALKIVGETIRQVYAGDIGAFLADAVANYGAVFGGVRRLLDVQMERLSSVEREVLRHLAVEREPVSLAEISEADGPEHACGAWSSRPSRRYDGGRWWSAATRARRSRSNPWCSST